MSPLLRTLLAWCSAAMTIGPTVAEGRFTLIVAPQSDTQLSEAAALNLVRVMAGQLNTICGPVRFSFGFQQLPASFQGAANDGAEMLRLYRATQTSLQIVPSISHCGISEAVAGGIFGGCTAETGPIILRDYPSNSSDQRLRLVQKWTHEMGHAQGLTRGFPGYANGHNTDPGSMMYWQAGQDRWQLASAECAKLYQTQSFPPPQVFPVVESDGETTESDVGTGAGGNDLKPSLPELTEITPLAPEDIGGLTEPATNAEGDDFLRGDWMEPLPIDAIEARRGDLLQQAERAIDDNMVTLWPGSAVLVAYAGTNGVVARLEKIIMANPAELGIEPGSDAAFQLNEAKIRATGALSYIPYRAANGDYSGDDAARARELLDQRGSLNANADLPFADDGRQRLSLGQEVTLNAAAGLALLASFDDRARAQLEELRWRNDSGALSLGVDDTFFEALDGRVLFDRANRSPQTTPLAEALTPRSQ